MITYVLIISEFFPKTHPKAGQPTGFITSIENKTKLHTIRGNYGLWKKRFEKIDKGEACLSVRVWSGKPYNSKQKEVFNFTKSDGIGIQRCFSLIGDEFVCKDRPNSIICKRPNSIIVEEYAFYVKKNIISKNDGLIELDFKNWFKDHDDELDMAIIHFTDFRY